MRDHVLRRAIAILVLLTSSTIAYQLEEQLEELPAAAIVPGDTGLNCQECAALNYGDNPDSKVCSQAFNNGPGQFCGYWSEHPLQNLRRPCCCKERMDCQLESFSCTCVSRTPHPTSTGSVASQALTHQQLKDENTDHTGILVGVLVGTLAPCLACCLCVHCLCRRKTRAAAPHIVNAKSKTKPYSPPAYVADNEEIRPAGQTDGDLVV